MRLPGWETRLAVEIDAARLKPFAWGSHDCATWAFDVRRALTGEDAAHAWRGLYSTAKGAQRWLRRQGWADYEAGARAILGEPVPPLTAQRGDIVLVEGAFGVCAGAVAMCLGETGLTERPMTDATLAWRV